MTAFRHEILSPVPRIRSLWTEQISFRPSGSVASESTRVHNTARATLRRHSATQVESMSARCNHVVISGVLLFASMLAIVAVAQNPTQQRGTDAYERALGDLLSLGHTTSLEVFLEDYPNSPLRKDALELLIWKYQQDHLLDNAASAARSLLRVDPENAAAL